MYGKKNFATQTKLLIANIPTATQSSERFI